MDRNLRIRMLLEAGDRVTGPLRDIAGGSTRAAQALKATRDRLKEIDRAQATIGSFRQLKAGLRTTDAAMHASQARVAALAREMAEAGTPTRKLAADFAKAKREAAALKTQHEAETRELQQLRDRLRAAGIATNDLARHERELRGASAAANTELAEQERRVTRLADRHRRLGAARERFDRIQGRAAGLAAGGAAAIGTGMAMAAPILASVKAAQEFQSTMTDIAQKANLSRAEAAKMGAGLLVAARAANQLPDALQAGVDTLSGFGLDPRKAVAMMRPIGRAATAYKAEIADLSAAAFAANDNLKVPVEQTARVIDIMAQAGKAGAFEIKDMAGAFPALTAGYQALGQTGTGAVADLAAALQIARKGAGDSATAASNVANIIQKIASPATIKAFSKFGIDLPAALKRAYAEGKTPLEAIAELTKKATGGDLGKMGFLFEDAQVQAGLRPLIQNLEEYKRIRAEAAGANGTTDTDFAERMQDSGEQSKALAINAKTLAITLGAMLLPTVNAVVVKVTAFATWIGNIATRYPTLTKAVVIGGAAFAALFLVLGGGALVIAGLVAPFAALAFAAGALNIAMLPMLGIVLAVVAGVALLAGAAYLLYTKWGAVKGFFSGLWTEIKAGFSGGITGIAGLIINFNPLGLFYRAFAGVMNYLGVAMPARLTDAGRWMMQGLINGITGMLGKLKSTIVGAASSAGNWFKAKLGIHSPSRVFTGYGGYIMQGLTNGIAAGEDGPIDRLTRLSKAMGTTIVAGTASVAMASGSAGGTAPSIAGASAAGGARTYNITINQLPGQSPRDLARQIADEIDRREAGTRTARAASFADTPDWSNRA